ncbi:MAG: ATP-dependent Clp protease adapter ClpS [Cellulomonadaceae bacterium]|nr:ATP-dependent Clp protease adapter ClpS [Cellulomonadaceae bacterium]
MLDPEVISGTNADISAPWITVVWNDPVNLMTYVSFVFESYFGFDETKARTLMLQVHHEGRAVVSSGPRERMEVDVAAMHGFGLWATMERDGSDGSGQGGSGPGGSGPSGFGTGGFDSGGPGGGSVR